MKRFLLLISALVLFVACSEGAITPDAPTPPEKPTAPKEYTVSLGMAGEITIVNTPLSKASTNDLYGIQVYSKPATGHVYSACAYGLFDNKTKMTINLLEGYVYKFLATMVVDGKNIMINYGNGYSAPFSVDSRAISLENKFVWETENMSWIDKGYTTMKVGTYFHPFADRYYGKVDGYAPIEGGSVAIDMKRTVFGVKFVADGLTEGELIINMDESPQITIAHGVATEIEKLVTFKGVSAAWATDGYTEDVAVSISWKKADDVVVPLVNQTVTFTRKQLSTITVKVKDSAVSSGMNLTEETGELATGENITLNAGDGIETPVVP